ncbi:polysaccharide lyase family 7 protein [Pseudomonas sp. LRF_L74]|uniref:polysaccharide lyase family 7 protein n=1 Tax=Pseudomonas sp. LRF_L74 TaxID=3369422 RepID=UPI003F622E7B
MLDLTSWILTTPQPKATVEVATARLATGYENQYYQVNGNDSVTFWVPVNGSTTESAKYPRSELREAYTNGERRNWYYNEAKNNILSAVVSVQQVPSKGKVVIGQIHSTDEPGSSNDPLLKLQYHYDEESGTGSIEALLRKRPGDKTSQNIPLITGVTLNERFAYRLRLTASGRLSIRVTNTDDNGAYSRQLAGAWGRQQLYFKAGAYPQDNSGPSSEGARVTFYHLNTAHGSL